MALEKIWSTVLSIPKDPRKRANLEQLKVKGVPDHQYKLKVGNSMHSGPFAMLVRESAFQSASMCNHDYLGVPEIIEDICNGYQQRFGDRIDEEVTAALKPCIVKFEATDRAGSDLLEPALMYCWGKAHQQAMSLESNTCYDAHGKVVPRSTIRRVEFVQLS